MLPILKKGAKSRRQKDSGEGGAEGPYRGPLVNGFRAVPEPESLRCSEESLAPFSLPAEVLSYEPPEDVIITPFKNGDRERKIHCNIELEAEELEKLTAMQQEAAAQGLEFFPSVSVMATRFLSRTRMDVKKAVKLMQATQEWRQGYFKDGPVTDHDVREDMKHGVVYFTGRDRQLRPTIVVRGSRIPQQWYKEKRVDKLIRILIFCMEYLMRYMVVPGKVESLCVIVDLGGLSISQVPISALAEVYKVMSHHYIGRVVRFYVCNLPWTLWTIAGAVKALLTDRQRQKIHILDSVDELLKDFAPHQLEEDLGGTRAAFDQFLPFPLQPGPYDPKATAPESPSQAVPNVHQALTAAGAMGRLWDRRRGAEENRRLEYSPDAADILASCGLPVPPELLEASAAGDGLEPGAEKVAEGNLSRCKTDASTEAWATDAEGQSRSGDEEGSGWEDELHTVKDVTEQEVVVATATGRSPWAWCWCEAVR